MCSFSDAEKTPCICNGVRSCVLATEKSCHLSYLKRGWRSTRPNTWRFRRTLYFSMKKKYDPMKLMFFQKSTPVHWRKLVQTLKREESLYVSSICWPSRSKGLSHCHYWIWDDVEKDSKAQPHTSMTFWRPL